MVIVIFSNANLIDLLLSLELRRNQFIVRYVYRRNGTNVSAVRCRGNKIFFRHFNFLATGK